MKSSSLITKRIIITGASSGLGAAITRTTARKGYTYFLTGRNKQNLENLVQDVKSKGGKAFFDIGDVGDEKDAKRICDLAVKEMGGVDVLIANAGIGRKGPIESVSISDFDNSFNTNVRGVFLFLHYLIPVMKKAASGQIIVISSLMGNRTTSGGALYCATKHAVEGMVGCVRKDLAGTGVKVGLINPGAIATPWWDEEERGGGTKPKSKHEKDLMLTPEAVASAVEGLMNQSEISDIERIVIEPRK